MSVYLPRANFTPVHALFIKLTNLQYIDLFAWTPLPLLLLLSCCCCCCDWACDCWDGEVLFLGPREWSELTIPYISFHWFPGDFTFSLLIFYFHFSSLLLLFLFNISTKNTAQIWYDFYEAKISHALLVSSELSCLVSDAGVCRVEFCKK